MIRKKSQYVIVTTTRGTFCKSPPLIMAATLNMENGSIERGYLFFKFLWSRQMLKRQCYFIQNNNNKITNTGLSAHKALWVLSELNRLPSNFSWAMNIAMKGMELTLVLICFCLFVCLFVLQVLALLSWMTEPRVHLSHVTSEEQLEKLLKLCVVPIVTVPDWGGTWAQHALTCMIQDLLQGTSCLEFLSFAHNS